MLNKKDGSKIAKDGFKNEYFVIETFNNWKTNEMAKHWLISMGYKLSDIEYVEAIKIKGSYKADVQVQIKLTIKLKKEIDCQNISVKLVSNPSGFNQIDKRWIDKHADLWNIPDNVVKLLKYYTGEMSPYKEDTKDNRRMFLFEFTNNEKECLLDFFRKNKVLILTDILKGRGQFACEWMLIVCNINNDITSKILPINEVLNFYANGDIVETKQGNIKMGRITVQRKGGDSGRKTANMLQFKMNPMDLMN